MSNPAVRIPKIVWLKFKFCGRLASDRPRSVTKNCELFVSSPELASANRPLDANVKAGLNSSLKFGRVEPPMPSPFGEPP